MKAGFMDFEDEYVSEMMRTAAEAGQRLMNSIDPDVLSGAATQRLMDSIDPDVLSGAATQRLMDSIDPDVLHAVVDAYPRPLQATGE